LNIQDAKERFTFLLNRLHERLWVKPLTFCLLSIAGTFVAEAADRTGLPFLPPSVSNDSLTTVLSIMASSMLVIAIFSVSSMVSAYASASSTATPRSFPLVIADDTSQNALSTFLGAFIFSIVALMALKNGYLETAGRFVLFSLTMLVFAVVVLTFVRWVDSVARLGRLATTIDMVEKAATSALVKRRATPRLHGTEVTSTEGWPVFSSTVGYVQRIDVTALQDCAEAMDCRIRVAALPGTFAFPERPLAWIVRAGKKPGERECAQVAKEFLIGSYRLFDDDPRLGLVVLTEIAGRALSPAVNDPGTAIDIIGRMVRLLVLWSAPTGTDETTSTVYDRVEVPELQIDDLFDDAFTAIARDGAGHVEVGTRLQKALAALSLVGPAPMRDAAIRHARLALARAEREMNIPEDVSLLRELARFADQQHAP
jgi:uncharacterized membrane protein